jgi:molybdate transport system substrate-binding protein
MSQPLTLVSSMATRQSLAALAAEYMAATGADVCVTSMGGVDAARRIRSGEHHDVVVLALDSLQRLATDRCVVDDSVTLFARSQTALAVRAGAPRPAACDAATLKPLLATARKVGVSSGPSGVRLRQLAQAWGLEPGFSERLIEAPPGVPVARLITTGEVDFGFQQWSELLDEEGIDVVGTLPEDVIPLTDFAVGRTAAAPVGEANALISFLTSVAAHETLMRYGLRPPKLGYGANSLPRSVRGRRA